MDYIVHPYGGISFSTHRQITFGMKPKSISAVIGKPDRLRSLSPEYGSAIHHHYAVDLVLHYDVDYKCNVIVVMPPSNAFLQGEALLNRPYRDIEAFLNHCGGSVVDGAGQMYYLESGVAIHESPVGVNSCLLAFVRGYTDGWQERRAQIMREVAAMPKQSAAESRAEMDELLHIDLDKFLES